MFSKPCSLHQHHVVVVVVVVFVSLLLQKVACSDCLSRTHLKSLKLLKTTRLKWRLELLNVPQFTKRRKKDFHPSTCSHSSCSCFERTPATLNETVRSLKPERPVLFRSHRLLRAQLSSPATASGVHSFSADKFGQHRPRLDVAIGVSDCS